MWLNYKPEVGETVTVENHTGYVLVQNRPWECRPVCVCGNCNGQSETVTVEIAQVISWADNSVEAFGTNGELIRISAPSGDICY